MGEVSTIPIAGSVADSQNALWVTSVEDLHDLLDARACRGEPSGVRKSRHLIRVDFPGECLSDVNVKSFEVSDAIDSDGACSLPDLL